MSTEHELPESESSNLAPLGSVASAPRAPSAEGALLLLLGVLCSAAGLALVVLPQFSWKAGQIMTGLDQLGVQGGALVMGGLALVGLGRVRRAQDSSRRRVEHDSELLLEQVAADLIETRGALERLEAANAEAAGAVESLRGQVADASADSAQSAQPQFGSNALFQLAASLDKLGAHLDQRLKVYQTTVQESLDELTASVEHSRRSAEERMALDAPATPPYAPDVTSDALSVPEPCGAAPADDARMPGSLGLLDALDDDGVLAALPSRAPAANVDFERLDDGADGLARELEQAARAAQADSSPWDEQLMVDHGDADTARKLEQLQSLLSDERLRAALESMRRHA